jgi:hypothetical protein
MAVVNRLTDEQLSALAAARDAVDYDTVPEYEHVGRAYMQERQLTKECSDFYSAAHVLLPELLSELRERRAADSSIDIVFDGPPSHQAGRFVEVEDAQGHGISIGTWIDRGDGMWALRIPAHALDITTEDRVALAFAKGAVAMYAASANRSASTSECERALSILDRLLAEVKP